MLQRINLSGDGEWSEQSYQNVFKIVRHVDLVEASNLTVLSAPPVNDDSYKHFEKIKSLLEQYEANRLLSFRIHTSIASKAGKRMKTHFNVYLQKLANLSTGTTTTFAARCRLPT